MRDLTPEDEALLQRARAGDLPTDEDQARVKQKVFAQLGIGLGAGTTAASAAGSAGPAAAATGALGMVTKVVVAVALIGGAVGTGAVVVRGVRGTPAPARQASIAPPPPPPTPTPTSTSTSTSTLPTPARAHAPSLAHARLETPPSAPALPAVNPAPPAPATDQAAIPSPTTPDAPPAAADTIAAEADLLRRADAARKSGDAAQALALLDELRARFPNGVLAEEREAERVVVLCALGRTDDARAAAARFLQLHPRSPLAGRVRASCAGP